MPGPNFNPSGSSRPEIPPLDFSKIPSYSSRRKQDSNNDEEKKQPDCQNSITLDIQELQDEQPSPSGSSDVYTPSISERNENKENKQPHVMQLQNRRNANIDGCTALGYFLSFFMFAFGTGSFANGFAKGKESNTEKTVSLVVGGFAMVVGLVTACWLRYSGRDRSSPNNGRGV